MRASVPGQTALVGTVQVPRVVVAAVRPPVACQVPVLRPVVAALAAAAISPAPPAALAW